MLEFARLKLAQWLSPPPAVMRKTPRIGQRMYAAARTPTNSTWATRNSSSDAELSSSLTKLRTASRALVRDAAYAKRASTVIKNNVIGTGIGMQAQVMTSRDAMNERINSAIEREWCEWACAKSCHTGGSLHFSDLERALLGQVFEAGEVFIRKHYQPFGDSEVPFALELIEAERLADEFTVPHVSTPQAEVRMGIEVDPFGRPLAYWIRERHPGDLRSVQGGAERYLRVPADQIIHLRVIDRWPQTRGEPWLHAVMRKLADMDGYTEAEIIAARGAACYGGVIETPDLENTAVGDTQEDGTSEIQLEPGMIPKLGPGEKFSDYMPNRPNAALDPFLRYMLRETAAGINISYFSLSQDASQSNYSSSRLTLIDDRDVWRVLQQWFIRSFREEVHAEWLQAAVLSGAIPEITVESYLMDPEKFGAVLFKPRGWSWVDPTKEVEAAKEAVRNGFTTVSRVVAATADGMDIEDVIAERKRELQLFKDAGLNFDTDVLDIVAATTKNATVPPAQPAPNDAEDPPARVIAMRK